MENNLCDKCKNNFYVFKTHCNHLYCTKCFKDLLNHNKTKITKNILELTIIEYSCTICKQANQLIDNDSIAKAINQIENNSKQNNHLKTYLSDIRTYSKEKFNQSNKLLENIKSLIDKLITRSYDKFNQFEDYMDLAMNTIDLIDIDDKANDNKNINSYNKLNQLERTINTNLNVIENFQNDILKLLNTNLNSIKIEAKKPSSGLEFIQASEFKGHKNSIYAITMLKNNLLASGSFDKTIKIWDLYSLENIDTLYGHDDSIECLLTLRNGLLLSGSADGTIRVWDTDNNFNQISVLKKTTKCTYFSLCELRNGLVASSSIEINIWDVSTSQCLLSLKSFAATLFSVIELNSDKLASSCSDSSIMIWDTNQKKCVKILHGHTSWVHPIVQLNDLRLASGSGDKSIRLWDPNQEYKCIAVLNGHTGPVFSMLQLRSGLLLSGSEDSTLRMWDLLKSECVRVVNAHQLTVFAIVQVEDDKIVTCSGDYTIKLWN
jgi:WD40 repeat protein